MAEKFDLVVIGAGPGGYVAAIKGAQLGMKTALIEKDELGGTCLNRGCIPTKTLLANAEVLSKVKRAQEYGIKTGDVSFDYGLMKSRKDGVVTDIRKSLTGLLKSNGIHIFQGLGHFTGPKEIRVTGADATLIEAEKIIIATGSETFDIPAFPCDHKRILNSTSILEMTQVPDSLAIIGGGYIGCEFASLFAELGVEVTIIEALPSIVAAQGKEISGALTKAFEKQGIRIITGSSVEKVDDLIHLSNGETVEAEKVLVSVGRRLYTDGLNLTKAGLAVGEKGAIEVNAQMETAVPGIYAIGDVTGKAMLAHVASHQGVIAATNAHGGEAVMHYHAVPAVIFTHPEIAMVGMNIEEAKAAGHDASVGKFPFMALGKAKASIEADGFAQVVIDRGSGQILGAQVVGHDAANLIAEMALAIHNELTIGCVAETIHAHPTIAEAWLEAAMIATDTPIHFPPKIKR